MTTLALLVMPLTLKAQDKVAEASQGTQEELNVDAADQQKPGTTETTPDVSSGKNDANRVVSASQPDTSLVPSSATWDSFHGQVNAQKYSPLKQITAENVGKLTKVWEFHTGDVSDGKGDTPATVWSATPIFANDTLYIGTPFDRLIALDPGTGKEKWHYDTKSPRKALTQPVLKNRGVSYWQAKNPVAGEACQKVVYMGTVDGKLYALDADSGKPCSNFADKGMLNVNQWNTVNAKFPLSILQPPTVVGDHLIVGWAGKDWAYAEAPPGSVFSLNARDPTADDAALRARPAQLRHVYSGRLR
jgi:quinoprotein glucose dehydrogenase